MQNGKKPSPLTANVRPFIERATTRSLGYDERDKAAVLLMLATVLAPTAPLMPVALLLAYVDAPGLIEKDAAWFAIETACVADSINLVAADKPPVSAVI